MIPATPLTCIIVDDEQTARYGLRSYVNKTPNLICVEEFPGVGYLEAYLRHNAAPDILFMDIRMPGQSGLDYIATKTVNSAIIIVTAYEQYALKGFELSVCDYLLKPVPYQRFKRAVEKATQYLSYLKGARTDDFIFIRADRIIHQIKLNDIIYLKALENYVQIYTTSKYTTPFGTNLTSSTPNPTPGTNRIITTSGNFATSYANSSHITTRTTLKALLSQLPSGQFIQIHKSYAINLRHIRSITNTTLIMLNTHELPLSKNFRTPLLQAISTPPNP